MNPVEAISSVFRNYINFSGRASRSEFWWFTLFSFVSQIAFYFIPFVGWLYALALLLPSLAVTARRLHDTGRSAWWMLLYLVSVLGFTVAVSALIAVLAISVFGPRFGEEMDWGIFAILIGILLIVSVVSAIVLLIFLIMPGTPGPNRYGPDPVTQQQGTGAFGGEPPGEPYTPTPATGGRSGSFLDAPPLEREPGGGKFCTQCGMQLQLDAKFCTECGAAL